MPEIPPAESEYVGYYCDECGHEWEVLHVLEDGGWEPVDDTDCPRCGEAGRRTI